MEAVVEIGRGRLVVPPGDHLPAVKESLTYMAKSFAEEVRHYVDANGVARTSVRRTNRVEMERRALYKENRDGSLSAPDGMVDRVVEAIRSCGVSPLVRRTDSGRAEPVLSRRVVRGLMPDQASVVADALSHVWDGSRHLRSGAVVDATMGYGKTYVIAALCRAYAHSGVLVTTKAAAVVSRLKSGLTEMLKDDGISVGVRRGAKATPGDVVVCTTASLGNVDPSTVGCLIYDEVHNAAAPTQSMELSRFHASVRFGLSGTTGDRFDGRHHLVEALFGTRCSTVTDADAEDLGRVVPLRVYVLDIPWGPAIESGTQPVAAERRAIWRNARRNREIARAVAMVPKDWQVLVFARTVEHASELMHKHLEEGFELFHGDLPSAEKARILSGFESGEILRVVSTDALGEGVDPSRLRVVVDANWTTSEAKVSQRAGRCRRHAPGKSVGYVVAFRDTFDKLARSKSMKRLAVYRGRGYEIVPVDGPDKLEFTT